MPLKALFKRNKMAVRHQTMRVDFLMQIQLLYRYKGRKQSHVEISYSLKCSQFWRKMTKLMTGFVSGRANSSCPASPEVLLWLLLWHTKPKLLHQQPALAREALNWES